MNKQNLQNRNEDEILSVEDIKLQQMIKNLHRVDAPKDFDFRLKARIANAKSIDFQPRFFPALRYVLPLSAIVLVFTFVIISGVYFGGNNQTAATTVPATPLRTDFAPTNNASIASPEVAQVPVQTAPNTALENSVQPNVEIKKKEIIPAEETNFVATKSKKTQIILPEKKTVEDDGGSRDLGLDGKPKIFTPRGTFSNDLVENTPNNEYKNDIITKQILLPLGIEIVSENGNRRVKAVKKDSVAERSSVKVGDLVEAIDGENVSGNSVHSKKLEGKQITVSRGAEKIEISFNNQ